MGFRSSNHPPSGPSGQTRVGPIPDGVYTVEITECNFVAVKTGDTLSKESLDYLMECQDEDAIGGKIGVGDPSLNLFTKFVVTEGAHSGYEVLNWSLFLHSKPEAMRIGREKIGLMSFAANCPDWDEPEQLIGKMLSIETMIRTSEKYGDKTAVKRYGNPLPRQAPPVDTQSVEPLRGDDDIPF